MTKLSVNINKVATIRNSRGGNIPDVIELQSKITTEFNIEGNPSPEFISLIKKIRPTQVTLVPDAHDVLTSDAGWNTLEHRDFLTEVVNEFQSMGVRTSIFVDTNLEMIKMASKIGADRIELYTGPYAEEFKTDKEKAVAPYVEAATMAKNLGLGVNAGHDLNLENLNYLYINIPWLKEVSIGHSLISDALYMGLEKTIKAYKNCLNTPVNSIKA